MVSVRFPCDNRICGDLYADTTMRSPSVWEHRARINIRRNADNSENESCSNEGVIRAQYLAAQVKRLIQLTPVTHVNSDAPL